MQIKDKVIIVTGASAGIGLAAVKLLAQKGAKVVLAARSLDKITEISKELPDSYAVETDMTNKTAITNMIDAVMTKYGRIDVLINNAGQGMYSPIEKVDVDNYRSIIELNVIGPVIAMQKVIPIMRKQGGGMIINISSMVSKNYYPNLGAYASTKYALNALTLTARQELEKDKIIVSAMHPGLTATDFGKNAVKTPETENMAPRNRENMPPADTAEYVAERIALTIESEKAEVYAHDEMDPSRH